MADDDAFEITAPEQRRVLVRVLVLNVLLAGALAVAGVTADSSALIANALDNVSDSAVYVISLAAIGRPQRWKRAAARTSAILLLVFGLAVIGDAWRRFTTGSEPVGWQMMAMSLVATAVNAWCVRLLRPLRSRDVNMRAAHTFSINDFVANLGILAAGVGVALTGRAWPDLAVGAAVAGIAIWGAIGIFRDAHEDAVHATD